MITFRIRVTDEGSVKLDALGKKAQNLEVQFGKTAGLIQKAFQGVLIYAGISKLIQTTGQVTNEIDKFHLSLKKIEQVGGITGRGLGQLSDQIRKLAVSTEYSQSQIADAGLVLARMGKDSASSIGKLLPNAMDLATVAGEDLTKTVTGLTQIMNVFGISDKDVVETTNKVGVALNATALDLSGYIDAMQYAAPAARAMGVSFEDATAMISYLSQVSIQGSRAGTTLKNTFIGLIDPTDKVAKALQANNLKAGDAVGIMKMLSESGVSMKEQLELFGRWAVSGTLAMTQEADTLVKLRDQIKSGTYDVHAHAEEIRTSAIPAYKQMWSAITEIGLSIGDNLGISKGQLILEFRNKMLSLAEWVKQNKEDFMNLGKTIKDTIDFGLELGKLIAEVILPNLKEIGTVIGGLFLLFKLEKFAGFLTQLGIFNVTLTGTKIAATEVGIAINSWLGPLGAVLIAATLVYEQLEKSKRLKEEQEKTQGSNLESGYGTRAYLNDLLELQRLQKNASSFAYKDFNQIESLTLRGTPQMQAKNELDKFAAQMAGKYGNNPLLTDSKHLQDIINRQVELIGKKGLESLGSLYRGTDDLTKTTNTTQDSLEELAKRVKLLADAMETASKSGVFSLLGGKLHPEESKLEDVYWLKNLSDKNVQRLTGGKRKSGFMRTGLTIEDQGGLYDQDIDSIAKAIEQGSKEGKALDSYAVGDMKNRGLLTAVENTFNKPSKDQSQKDFDKKYNDIMNLTQASTDLVINSAGIVMAIEDDKHEKIMNNLEKEKSALDSRYQKELAAAGNNAFKRQIIEQKYAQKKSELDKKMEAEKDAQARREKLRSIFLATIQMPLVILGAMRDMWGGPIERLTAGVAIAAALAGYIGTIVAANYREGGVVDGHGNSTSDSIWAKVSRGERVLSVSEVSRLGGNERVQQLIDREIVNNNKNINVNISTVYGSRQFVREMITEIKQELSR